MSNGHLPEEPRPATAPSPDEVAEVPLRLTTEQLALLTQVARGHGLTVGQFLRRTVAAILSARRREPVALPATA
jgi:hypothetical protein